MAYSIVADLVTGSGPQSVTCISTDAVSTVPREPAGMMGASRPYNSTECSVACCHVTSLTESTKVLGVCLLRYLATKFIEARTVKIHEMELAMLFLWRCSLCFQMYWIIGDPLAVARVSYVHLRK